MCYNNATHVLVITLCAVCAEGFSNRSILYVYVYVSRFAKKTPLSSQSMSNSKRTRKPSLKVIENMEAEEVIR